MPIALGRGQGDGNHAGTHLYRAVGKLMGGPSNGFSFPHRKSERRGPLKMECGVGKSKKSPQMAQISTPREGLWVLSSVKCV